MLAVVGCVLAGFASFFIYLVRRARTVAAEAGPVDAGRHVLQGSNPNEGTARC
jgi:hypothetical protein